MCSKEFLPVKIRQDRTAVGINLCKYASVLLIFLCIFFFFKYRNGINSGSRVGTITNDNDRNGRKFEWKNFNVI